MTTTARSAVPATMREEVLAALARTPRELPCKYLYDARGARLFERICRLPEYDLTRTELGILRRAAGEIADWVGPDGLVVEFGSGAGRKTRILLDALATPAAYVPVDICGAQLAATARRLAERYPALEVLPIAADFAAPVSCPGSRRRARRRVVFFPGSTLGNLTPDDARRFLARTARLAGPGGGLILGVDLVRDPARLLAAYDDAAGVTAAFNLNLLRRLNRELGADFRLELFRHRAVWNAVHERIEMHLVCTASGAVTIAGRTFALEAGEFIHTESAHKYRLDGLVALTQAAGWRCERIWQDPRRWFTVGAFATD